MTRSGVPPPSLELDDILRLSVDELRSSLARAHPDEHALDRLMEQAEARLRDDVPRGLVATELVCRVVDEHGDDARCSSAHRLHARALAMSNRFEPALAAARSSAQAAARAGQPVAAARASMVMLHALARLGRHEEAIAEGEAARRIFEDAGETELAAKADGNLGEAYRLTNEPATAIACFDRARRVLGRSAVMAAPLENNRAQALLDLNRFEEAEVGFRTALDAFASADMRVGRAIVEGNLADLMSRQGRVERALYHFERARRFFETSGAAGDLARLEAEHADVLALAGATAEAVDAYTHALPELTRHGLRAEAARAAIGCGRALIRLGRWSEAGTMLAAARRTYEELEHTHGVALATLAEGELHRAVGDVSAARDAFRRALRHAVDRPADAAVMRHALATTLLELGEVEEADQVLLDAIADATALEVSPLVAELLHGRARIRRAQGRDDLARADLVAAIERIERVRGSLQAERFRAVFLGARSGVYDDLIGLLVEGESADGLREAFGVAERARSRALLDLVMRGGDLADVTARAGETEDPIAVQLEGALATLNALYSRLSDEASAVLTPEAGRLWREQVLDAERTVQQLEQRMASTERMGGVFADPLDLADVQARLDEDTTLVMYHVLPEHTVAFVVRRDAFHARILRVTGPELTEMIERFRFQVSRVAGYPEEQRDDPVLAEDARIELRSLHAALLAPLEDALGSPGHVLVVPHAQLHAVPFAALYDGSSYLIERATVSSLPSASLVDRVTNAPAPSRGGVVILGAADAAAPAIDAEVARIQSALGPAVRVVDSAATTAALFEHAPGSAVVHVACHGRFSALSPRSSGLRLVDRWLTLREIYGLDLSGGFVVLSGCDTGQTMVEGADEVIGLERGFFVAGVRGLILSSWSLHDESALELMASAYRLWASGNRDGTTGFALALIEAQRQLMRKRPHPAFWAPLVWIGVR